MITIEYETYICDYARKFYTKRFATLKELEDWIFGQMKRPCNDDFAMWFPRKDAIGHIIFVPERNGAKYWIHKIDYNFDCVFSDGTMTNGEKFMSNAIKKWCAALEERRKDKPKFLEIDLIE